MPERKALTVPESNDDMMRMLIYYESLVQQWEAWGECVERLTGSNNETKAM